MACVLLGLGLGLVFTCTESWPAFFAVLVVAFVSGVTLIIPIGGGFGGEATTAVAGSAVQRPVKHGTADDAALVLGNAEVPYDQAFEREDIHGEFGQADVAIILGANERALRCAGQRQRAPAPNYSVTKYFDTQFNLCIKKHYSQ